MILLNVKRLLTLEIIWKISLSLKGLLVGSICGMSTIVELFSSEVNPVAQSGGAAEYTDCIFA